MYHCPRADDGYLLSLLLDHGLSPNKCIRLTRSGLEADEVAIPLLYVAAWMNQRVSVCKGSHSSGLEKAANFVFMSKATVSRVYKAGDGYIHEC